jgi:hypothetical protein
LDLLDVDVDVLAVDRPQLGAELVDLGTLAADDNTGTGGEDVDPDLVRRALDVDLCDARVREARLERLPEAKVFVQELRVVGIGEPA